MNQNEEAEPQQTIYGSNWKKKWVEYYFVVQQKGETMFVKLNCCTTKFNDGNATILFYCRTEQDWNLHLFDYVILISFDWHIKDMTLQIIFKSESQYL